VVNSLFFFFFLKKKIFKGPPFRLHTSGVLKKGVGGFMNEFKKRKCKIHGLNFFFFFCLIFFFLKKKKKKEVKKKKKKKKKKSLAVACKWLLEWDQVDIK